MKDIYYHARIRLDAAQIYDYYARISQKLADDFWQELENKVSRAGEFPERHHFDPSGMRRSNLDRFPIHFLFREFSDYIRVIVIRHDKRSPSFGLRRR